MAQFDAERFIENVKTASDQELRAIAAELASRLDNRPYGLVWETTSSSNIGLFEPEDIVAQYDNSEISLSFNESFSMLPNENGNLLLEGDNYVWLKILSQIETDSIDVICIDPPYNTGNGDFKYNDKFVDADDVFRHSKWLDFMDKRLQIAKDLLADNGLIFIHIGEDEIAQLKMLCDQTFGSFITIFHWIQTTNPPSLGRVRNNIEYILCYQKKPTRMKLFGAPSTEGDSPLANKGNALAELRIPAGSCIFGCDSGTIEKGFKPSDLELLDDIVVENKLNTTDFRVRFHSKWHQDYLNNELANGTVLFVKNPKHFALRYKKKLIGYVVPDKFLSPDKFDVKDNEYGRKQLEDALGQVDMFPFPKNTPLIKTLIRMFRGDNYRQATILDFFAGSGTTAQAVEELNQEDGGSRRWILITNNENQEDGNTNPETGICRSVTKPRIDAVITGERPDGSTYGNGTNSGYHYFQYDLIPCDEEQISADADKDLELLSDIIRKAN